MDKNKKTVMIHYLTEFLLIFIALGILVIIFIVQDFNFSWNIFPLWVFLVNGILFTFWLWKDNSKIWEKSIAGAYFVLVEIIIASAAF